MHDLTSGSLTRHLLKTTSYMLVTMVFQTLYFLIDLYWVGRLGTSAVAAVAIAGNWTFVVLAFTQMLGVGTTAVVSHAFGRREPQTANRLFNQSQVLASVTAVLFLVAGLSLCLPYARAMAADETTARMAADYLFWFIPAMALQFLLVSMGASLRGAGNFRPGTMVSAATVTLNMLLAPVLIFGWGTGHAFGVKGAAMSSLVAVCVGVVWLATWFGGRERSLRFDRRQWRPDLGAWRRMLAIGMPVGFEFAIMAATLVLMYAVMRPFGSEAQAGFGIGMRVMQAGFMVVVALGMSVAPVAGQNYGARLAHRVTATFRNAAIMAGGYQLAFAILCAVAAPTLVGVFADDPATIRWGSTYLRITTLAFVASGLIFVSSSMFQAMGNTMPALIASASRFMLFAAPTVVLARSPSLQLSWLWYLGVATSWIQLGLCLAFLRRQFRHRLNFGTSVDTLVPAVEPA